LPPRPGNLLIRFPPPAAGPPSLTGALERHPSQPRKGFPEKGEEPKKTAGEGPPAGGERRERLPRHFLRALPDLDEEPEDFEDEELDRPEELERPEEEEPPDLTEPDERLEEPPPDRGAL